MPRVLIINPSALVEIVHGLQVLTSMKAQWPADKDPLQVDWIVRDIFAPLVDSCSAVDRTYVFKRYGGTMEFLRLMKEVRTVRYDYLFDFQGLLRTGLMTWQAHAKRKIGRANAREGAAAFYDSKVPLPPNGRRSHKLEILLHFLPSLGLKPELAGKLDFRGAEKLKLSFVEGRRGSRIILMFPDARHANKNWQGFKQLTRMILEKHRDCRVIWAGDTQLADKGAFSAERFLNITGTTASCPCLVSCRRPSGSFLTIPAHFIWRLPWGFAPSASSDLPTGSYMGLIP